MSADTPNRRAVLTGTTAGVAAVALDVAPFVRTAVARPAAEHPDAALLALRPAWLVAHERGETADRIRTEAASRYDRLSEPEALFFRASDARFFGDFKGDEDVACSKPSGRRGFFNRYTLAAVQIALDKLREQGVPDYPVRKSHLEKVARLEEIVAANAKWEIDCHQHWIASGMEAAEQAFEAANGEEFNLRILVIQTPARSSAGMAFKLEVASALWGWSGVPAQDRLRESVTSGFADEDTMAHSILLDALYGFGADQVANI